MTFRRFWLSGLTLVLVVLLFKALTLDTPNSSAFVWPLAVVILLLQLIPHKRLGTASFIKLIEAGVKAKTGSD